MKNTREDKLQTVDRKQKRLGNFSKLNTNLSLVFILAIFVFVASCFIVYFGSEPVSYSININDVSSYDIDAPRTIINQKETERLALEAMQAVSGKMIENEESTAQSLANVESLISLVKERRERLYYGENTTSVTRTQTNNQETQVTEAEQMERARRNPSDDEIATNATSMVSQINQNYKIEFALNFANSLLAMSEDRFQYFEDNLRSISTLIMAKALDNEKLEVEIRDQVRRLSETQSYYDDSEIIQVLLSKLLTSNVEYDHAATMNAKEDAANQIRNNPIKINQGSRIVSQGEIITEDTYEILRELNLTDTNSFDWVKFAGIALQNLTLFTIIFLFIKFYKMHVLLDKQSLLAITIAFLFPLIVSFYIAKRFPLASPVYFSTIIICAYFGFKASLVMSTVLTLMIYPMTSFNIYFIPVTLAGCLIASIFSRKITREDQYVKLILTTTLATVTTIFALSIIREVTLSGIIINVISTVIASMVSVIAAIGVMPVFELLFNTVSPMKIIELSQPGQPLMKRLFTEAPGTSQHSMMVANLADAGCEAIGADTNLVRVGAYYHDIGKLENPMMFTENQMGENPHDRLTPQESCQIITAHTEDGLRLGKKHHLPEPVLKMIHEHHGTTVLQYFYHKACQNAEQEGREKPDKDLFRYHNPLPSFRESAVLMLADSVEAAMKSSDIVDVNEAEKFMRNIFKIKIDQNQLINSGLSFKDIELILQAFLQVYAGQFHTRVKYPQQEDNAEAV